MADKSIIYVPSWDIKPLSEQVLSTDKAETTAAIIHWKTTAGGWTYVDVKVSPSGALQVGGNIQINE